MPLLRRIVDLGADLAVDLYVVEDDNQGGG